MSMFLCLVRPDGSPVTDDIRRSFACRAAARTYLPSRWYVDREFAALVGSDIPELYPEIARHSTWIGVGTVRLDDPQQVRRLAGIPVNTRASNLHLMLGAVRAQGSAVIAKFLGDFSFVAWNRQTRELIAARDTFGVKRLFMAQLRDVLAFSTRASLLESGGDYDLQYIARYLAVGATEDGTPFKGVDVVRSAEVIARRNGTIRHSRYWPTNAVGEPLHASGHEVVDEFRGLLFEAVRTRLTGRAEVWAQLSGGMDSSSIVSVAQTLAALGRVPTGVQGAITLISTPPTGADSEHAALVAAQYGLRWERLGNSWLWQDDSLGPPLLDLPMAAQSNYSIERRMSALVHGAGGRIIFAGAGADLYLQPDLTRGARLLREGRLREAARETLLLASSARVSFWEFGRRYTLGPLLPSSWRGSGDPGACPPHWVSPGFARRCGIHEQSHDARLLGASTEGHARASSIAALLSQGALLARERIGEPNLEWRYPFLYRPLVEHGLRLPPEWLFEPRCAKRVLREAMRGILPEAVRTRQGKGGLAPHYPRAVVTERDRLLRLVAGSRLAELGCIDPTKLAAVISSDEEQIDAQITPLINVLSLEFWLQRRAGAQHPTPSSFAPSLASTASLGSDPDPQFNKEVV